MFFSTPPSCPELCKCPRALPRAAPEEAWPKSPPGEGRAAYGPPSGAGGFLSRRIHVCLILTVLSPLLVCLPCPGWDRFLLYLGRLVSRRVHWWGLWMFVMVGKGGRREKWNQQAKIYIYKYQSIDSLSWQRRVIRKNTSDFTQDPWCILLHSILSAKSRCSAWQPTKLLSPPPM